jgi:F-type H+-transporting ATPase subunit b
MLDALGLNLKEIIFVIVDFLILVGVLGKFLYKPFLGALETRKQSIKDAYQNAEILNRRADAKMAKYERRISNAEDEAREIVKEGKQIADKQTAQIIEEANQKAADIVKRAEQAADLEKAKAIESLREEIADMVIMAAEQVVGREIEKEGHKAIIDDVIDKARSTQWQN